MMPFICKVCDKPITDNNGLVELSHSTKKMRVAHHTCTNDENEYGYFFNIPLTLNSWCGWLFHLSDKNWFDDDMAKHFLKMWWYGRNEDRPQPL